jgi:gas vesicle protein
MLKRVVLKMDNKHGLEKYLVAGLLAGGTIGSIIGLIFAPKSGKQMRRDIKNKTEVYVCQAES